MSRGFAGIVVPGQARGAPADALNLVLWHWHDRLRLRHYAASINGRSIERQELEVSGHSSPTSFALSDAYLAVKSS